MKHSLAIKASLAQIANRGRPCRTLGIFSHRELLTRPARAPPPTFLLCAFTLRERDARFIVSKKIAACLNRSDGSIETARRVVMLR